MQIKQSCKGDPKHEDPRPKARSKRGQNVAMRKRRDRAKQWPPRAAHGRAHGLWWRNERPCVPVVLQVFAVFARLFDFRRFLLCFCLIIPMYLGILEHPIHSIAFSNFQSQIRVVFRERRGSDKELQGFWSRFCDRKTKARIWMSNSSLLSSFSHLQFYIL